MNIVKRIVRRAIGERLYTKLSHKIYTYCHKEGDYGRDTLKRLSTNAEFKNQYAGKRCFILGNGPSLGTVDFGSLADEYVFTCNFFGFVKGHEKAKPNFHLWMDPAFFELDEGSKVDHDKILENFHRMEQFSPICFMGEYGHDFVEKYELDKKLDIHYLGIDHAAFTHADPIQLDITRPLVDYMTVVQCAITVAMYMGFSEIYLLGIDSTALYHTLNTAMGIEKSNLHAYDEKVDSSDVRTKEELKKYSMASFYWVEYLLFKGYLSLREKCDELGIKLVNCSSTTLVNEIPRENLEDVLKRPRP